MAQQSDPMQDFIKNYMMVQQFTEQQRQFDESQALAQRQVENAEIQQFVGLASKARSPQELDAVTQFLGSRNPGMQETFDQLRSQMLPSLEVQQQILTQQGVGQLAADPARQKSVADAAVLKMATGQTAGQFGLDQATASLSPAELQQAAKIGTQIELSPAEQTGFGLQARGQDIQSRGQELSYSAQLRGQDLSFQSSMAGNRLGWAQLAQQGELGMLGMQIDMARMQASAGGGGLTTSDVPELIKTQRQLVEDLGKAPTAAAAQQLETGLTAINGLLNGLGIPTPQTGTAVGKSQFQSGWPWQARDTLPMYFPTVPRR